MTDIYESLEKLGLTRNEVTIYKYLLRKGISSGAQIWGENSLDKSSAYRAIGQLQEKRLIYAIGETRNQKFAAFPVESLVELHTKVEKNLSSVRGDIEKFVLDINEYAKENYKSSRIQLYEGPEGYKLFAEQRLQGHLSVIRQLGPRQIDLENFHSVNEGFIHNRVNKGVSIQLLYGNNLPKSKSVIRQLTDKEQLKEVRSVDMVLPDNAAIASHSDSVSFFTQEDGQFMGVVIKDRLIVSMFNAMFDFIWNQGKEI